MTVLLLFYDVKIDDVCLWPLLRFVNCKLSGLCTIHLYKTMYSGNIFFSNEAMRTFQFHLLNWLLLAFRLVLIQRFTFFFQRALSMITHCLQRNVESTAICVRWVRLCLSIIVTLMKIRPHFWVIYAEIHIISKCSQMYYFAVCFCFYMMFTSFQGKDLTLFIQNFLNSKLV